MEHRWGNRLTVDFGVRVAERRYNVRAARIVDLSASGAYIEVSADLRVLSRVQIAMAPPYRLPHPTPLVAAYVARKGKDGVGVEWCEYAPKPVLDLLRYAAAHPHGRRSGEPGRYVIASDRLNEPQSCAEA
jgi:hypothetical protein